MSDPSSASRLGLAAEPAVPTGQRTRVPTMDGFIAASSLANGVHLDRVDPLTELSVRTLNSTYHILVVEPHRARILVRGGQFYPIQTDAVLGGSSLGGGCLKMKWIGEGFCMEIHAHEGISIVTSPVQSITFESGQLHPL